MSTNATRTHLLRTRGGPVLAPTSHPHRHEPLTARARALSGRAPPPRDAWIVSAVTSARAAQGTIVMSRDRAGGRARRCDGRTMGSACALHRGIGGGMHNPGTP